MSKPNSSFPVTRAPRLTAQRKLELYLATRPAEAPLGELVRQYGVHLDDLRHIEQTIERAALAALKAQGRHGQLPREVSPERVLQLEQELREKTSALADLSVAYSLLEKKERLASAASSPANGSRRRRAKWS
jgi:hypothetical protein